MDIAALYFDLVSQRSAPKKQKQQTNNSSMNEDTINYWKREITLLKAETRGVCKLNWNSSYLHKAHVLSRNHFGDKSMPDELWDYWVYYVKEVQEELIREGYTDAKLLHQEEGHSQMDGDQQTQLLSYAIP